MKRISCERDKSVGLKEEEGTFAQSQDAGPHLEELVHPQPVDARPLSFKGLQETLHVQQLCREQKGWVTISILVRVTDLSQSHLRPSTSWKLWIRPEI